MFTTINDIRGSLIRVSIDLQYHVVLVSVRAKAEIPCLAAQMHLLFSHVIGYDFSRQYPFRYPYTHIVNKKRRYVQRKFRSYRHIHAWTRTPYRILTYPANLWELGGGGGGGWRGRSVHISHQKGDSLWILIWLAMPLETSDGQGNMYMKTAQRGHL